MKSTLSAMAGRAARAASILAVFALAALAGTASATDAPAGSAAAADTGTWQKHQYSFVFMGFTSTYSCDGLADKLKLLLIAAGARKDVKARPGACAEGFGRPDKFARAELTFYTLAPPGMAKPQSGTETADVPGTWRRVTLAQYFPQQLQLGDCELVEQFRDKLLPMFATRNVQDRTGCIPHQLSGSRIGLTFESFAALPPRAQPPAR